MSDPGIPPAERAAAEAEIRNLVAAVAQLADTGALEAYLDLFTADAVWEMPANEAVGLPASRRQGRDEIGAGVRERRNAGIQGPDADTLHVVSTTRVQLASSERARATSYFAFHADCSTGPRLVNMGQYLDELVVEGGRWRLARRVIVFGGTAAG